MQKSDLYLDYDFVSKHLSLSWADVYFGVRNGFLNSSVPITIAISEVETNSNVSDEVMQLAYLLPGEQAPEILEKLARTSRESEKATVNEKMLQLCLWNIVESGTDLTETISQVEELYTDFEYPEKLSQFIRYMPFQTYDHSKIFADLVSYKRALASYLKTNRISETSRLLASSL